MAQANNRKAALDAEFSDLYRTHLRDVYSYAQSTPAFPHEAAGKAACMLSPMTFQTIKGVPRYIKRLKALGNGQSSHCLNVL